MLAPRIRAWAAVLRPPAMPAAPLRIPTARTVQVPASRLGAGNPGDLLVSGDPPVALLRCTYSLPAVISIRGFLGSGARAPLPGRDLRPGWRRRACGRRP